MWESLAISISAIVALVFIPSFLLLRAFGIHRIICFAAAPLVASSVYSAEAIIYAKAGIQSNWVSIVSPLLILGIACLIGSFALKKKGVISNENKSFGTNQSIRQLLAFIAVGAIASIAIYAAPLESASSFVCGNDIVHHLSLNRSFIDSGNWSTLETTTTPGEGSAFYPSLWNLFAALAMSLTGATPVVASNAVNMTLIGVFYPVSLYFLGTTIFQEKKMAMYFLAILSFTFFGFPWEMFMRKVLLYPNALGLALMPGFLAAFACCLASGIKRGERACAIALAFAGVSTVSLAHPNTLFTALVFVFAIVLYKTVSFFGSKPGRNGSLSRQIICAVLVILAFSTAWVALSLAPFMQNVVTNTYDATSNITGTAIRMMLFKSPHLGTQASLSLLTIAGAYGCLRQKELRWLLIPFAISSLLFVVGTSLNPCLLKSILIGFWYNHPTRVFACASFFALPVAAIGACTITSFIEMLISKMQGTGSHARNSIDNDASPVLTATLTAAIALFAYINPMPAPNAMGISEVFDELKKINDADYKTSFFRQDERDFVNEASEIIPEGSQVLNVPNDGSAFAYALFGTNVSGRDFYNSETCTSALGSKVIEEIGRDPKAAQKLTKMGFQYIIVLDEPDQSPTIYQNRYDESQWTGMHGIAKRNLPYLKPVLKKDDMALYEIIPQ